MEFEDEELLPDMVQCDDSDIENEETVENITKSKWNMTILICLMT